MVLGRAAFGVRGNKLPSAISWLLTVGWETVLIILSTLATATVFERLGWGGAGRERDGGGSPSNTGRRAAPPQLNVAATSGDPFSCR